MKFDYPSVVYSHINVIRSKRFNFNKFIRNLDAKAFLQDNSTTQDIFLINCEGSDFLNKNSQHYSNCWLPNHKK